MVWPSAGIAHTDAVISMLVIIPGAWTWMINSISNTASNDAHNEAAYYYETTNPSDLPSFPNSDFGALLEIFYQPCRCVNFESFSSIGSFENLIMKFRNSMINILAKDHFWYEMTGRYWNFLSGFYNLIFFWNLLMYFWSKNGFPNWN